MKIGELNINVDEILEIKSDLLNKYRLSLYRIYPEIFDYIDFNNDAIFWIMPKSCVYAKILANLYKKNLTSFTPLNCALKALILALKDSAEALVDLLIK